ncbi:dynamin family protein [Actinoplanes siamensis]|uniref:Dynamin family protein n=1 Tax=Actinoplanes siamensis TaxID=1223317 RepID=A0A919N9P2_9ACTN|nr:dynamin family protein [Actinoplanes siamensis]GIF06933.1 hypothetical protein Asi03nite_44710 [Actinoplanes siamensis]
MTVKLENGLGRLHRDGERAGAALEALQDAAARLGNTGLADQLARLIEQFRRNVLRVAFVGHFDAGKSTLINALLGGRALPARMRPTTAMITVVRSGADDAARLHFRDRGREPIPVPLAELESHLVIDGKDDAPSPYDMVVIPHRSDLLADGVELADTPGLGDAYRNSQARLDAVVRYVAAADAVVYVSTSNGFMGADDQNFVYDVLQPIGHSALLVVGTWADALEDEPGGPDAAKAYLTGTVAEIAPAERVFFVNGIGAVKAHEAGDRLALAASGVPAFEAALRSFLVDRKAGVKLSRAVLAAERVADGLTAEIAQLRDLREQDADKVRSRCTAVEEQLPVLRKQRKSVRHTMAPIVARLEAEVQDCAADFLRATADSCAEWIAAMDDPQAVSLIERFQVTARAKAAAQAAADELSGRLQREVASWQRERLGAIVERHLAELRRAVDPDLASASAFADQLLRTLDGKDAEATGGGSLRWHLHDLDPVALEHPAPAASTAIHEIAAQAAARMIAIGIVAQFLSLFTMLPGVAVAAVLGAFVPGWGERAVRRKVGETTAARLRAEAPAWGAAVRRTVAEGVGTMRATLDTAMREQVADIEDRIKARRAALDGDPDGVVRDLDRATEAVRFARAKIAEIG